MALSDNRKLKEFICINTRPEPFAKQIVRGEHYMIDMNDIWDDDGEKISRVYTMDDKYVGHLYLYHFEEVGQ